MTRLSNLQPILALVYVTEELSDPEFREFRVAFNAHPGIVETRVRPGPVDVRSPDVHGLCSLAMVFSHCWVGSPGWLCLPATTSFEFLIRKPPCNYWINVNYESWLGLRHRYRYRRTRVELSLFLSLPLCLYLCPLYLAISFQPPLTFSLQLPLTVSPSLFLLFNPLSFLCLLPSTLLHRHPLSCSFGKPLLSRRGLGIIKIRWLICKFNKITVLGMPGADKRLYRDSLYRGWVCCSVWLSFEN